MSDAKESQENLLRVKSDGTGIDVAVGKDVPDLLARVFPTKYRFRRAADDAISGGILEKIRIGSDLSEAELAFAENMVSENAKKFMRLTSIERRAQALIEERGVPLLQGTAPKEDADRPRTSDDWVNKFREDASLVDDELVREIYARVLSEEHRTPGAFSLRTIGVLRYLDHEAATAFGVLQKVLLDGYIVPDGSVTMAVGLDHLKMLTLVDAGLVNSTFSEYDSEVETFLMGLKGLRRLVVARRADNSQFTVTIRGRLLTPAGKQLSRIAECERDKHAFAAVVDWLRRQVGEAQLSVAELPSRDWSGSVDQLTWRSLS